MWPLGAQVNYWVDDQNPDRRGWHGPATVAGQAGKQVRLRHGAAWTTRHTACLRPSGALTNKDQAPAAIAYAPAPAAAETPAGTSPPTTNGATARSPSPTRSAGTSDMLRRAAAAVQANALLSAAVAPKSEACASSFTGLEPGSPDSTAVEQISGSSLAHLLGADAGNLEAQLEKLHAQWQHISAPGTLWHVFE